MFEPFFSTKPKHAGTGLGLSVVHGIVESHAGAIDIQSRPGAGTRIDVYLPAARRDVATTVPAREHEPRPGTAHVLVVDDEEDLARMLKREIESFGLRVTAHTSSIDALETFQAQPHTFDLLITDNTMPRMSGLALAREIHRQRPDLPILLISGIAQLSDPAELRAQGVTRLLPKPHSLRELERVIEELLSP